MEGDVIDLQNNLNNWQQEYIELDTFQQLNTTSGNQYLLAAQGETFILNNNLENQYTINENQTLGDDIGLKPEMEQQNVQD